VEWSLFAAVSVLRVPTLPCARKLLDSLDRQFFGASRRCFLSGHGVPTLILLHPLGLLVRPFAFVVKYDFCNRFKIRVSACGSVVTGGTENGHFKKSPLYTLVI
jgi:hypothetical protein